MQKISFTNNMVYHEENFNKENKDINKPVKIQQKPCILGKPK